MYIYIFPLIEARSLIQAGSPIEAAVQPGYNAEYHRTGALCHS